MQLPAFINCLLLLLVSDCWNIYLNNLFIVLSQTLHLVEQLCLALNDEFRSYLPVILPCCIQVLSDAERCSDFTYVHDILHTLEVFGGQCCLFLMYLGASLFIL